MKNKIFRLALCTLLILAMTAGTMSAFAAPKIVMILKCTVDYGRLREGPSSDYDVVAKLEKGERVFYLGEKEGSFAYVRTATGEMGYIYDGFLESYGAARYDQIYYAAEKGVCVYKKNSTGSGRVTRLAENEHVIVFKVVGDWGFVKTLEGKGGYMRLSDLYQV